ncbi:hypothetical protein GCM10010363_22710 [Streptomyces omiyaensis]|nr:hypothetical protein GCM10010363_22710 [Streptomyces omiyaensis]
MQWTWRMSSGGWGRAFVRGGRSGRAARIAIGARARNGAYGLRRRSAGRRTGGSRTGTPAAARAGPRGAPLRAT